MSDPISTMIEVNGGGEAAILINPGIPPNFDPSDPADYVPPTPVEIAVRGVPEDKQMREGMAEGVSGAFTFAASAKPAGLQAGASKLLWRGVTHTVVDYRERSFMSAVNGYTLFLRK